MAETYYLGLMLFVTSLFVRLPHVELPRNLRPVSPWMAVILASCLCWSLGEHLHILGEAAASQSVQGWERQLPLRFFTLGRRFDTEAFPSVTTSIIALSAVDALCLIGLYVVVRTLRESQRLVTLICVCAVAMLMVESLTATFGGPDIYAYIGLGETASPYHPVNVALPVLDAPISRIWGRPLLPSPYGPLWNTIAHAVAASSSDLGAQAFAFRCLGLCGVLVSIVALVAQRKLTAAALFALNPAVWQLYVAEAHNDIVGIALVLVAFACRRNTILAILLVGLAGTIKLPFVLVGVLVFASEENVRRRFTLAAAGLLAGGGLSVVFGGGAYVSAMHDIAMRSAHAISPYLYGFHIALAMLALLAVFLAVWKKRFFWGASFSFIALGQYPAAQYLGWAIPYALGDQTEGALYLISLPIAAYMSNFLFPPTALFTLGCDTLFVVLLMSLALRIRKLIRRADGVDVGPRAGSIRS